MYRKDWIARWALYAPDKIAIAEFETGSTITYKELNNAANHLADKLLSDGHKHGDRIALLAENSIDHFILFSAAQKTGFILAPLNYRLTRSELSYMLEDADPALLICEKKFKSLVDDKYKSRIWDWADFSDWNKLHYTTDSNFKSLAIDEDQAVFILYTSGSTGFPKGAIYSHKMLLWNSLNTEIRLNITSDDRTITCLPLFHTGGWNVLSTPFLHHGAYFLITKAFDPEQVLALMETDGTTLFMGVPTMLAMMASQQQFKTVLLQNLRYFIVGGEAMPIPLIETWATKGIAIRQGYGMTEVGPNLTSLHQDDALVKKGSIGVPNFYVDVKIIDENNNVVNDGAAGELLLKGPMVTPAYWNNPDATNEAFIDGWFKTGDVVKSDDDGYLYVVDRIKNMYISGGENVYPVEVEKFLITIEGIKEVAVIGVLDPKWGESGRAFVVVNKDSDLTAQAIRDFCQDKIARFKIPRDIMFLDELPKGDTGKINRKILKNLRGDK